MEEMILTSTSGRIAGFIAEPIQGVGRFITLLRNISKLWPVLYEIRRRLYQRRSPDRLGPHGRKMVRDRAIRRDPGHHHLRQESRQRRAHRTHRGASRKVADSVKGNTISTFGGNPVTTTIAKAVIDFIDDNNLLINAAETGAYLRATLEEMKARFPLIGEVRGMGLMQAMELVEDRETRKPAAAATAALLESSRENRLLIGKGGTYGNVIRISPPMNISRSDVDEFASRLGASLQRVTDSRMATAAR